MHHPSVAANTISVSHRDARRTHTHKDIHTLRNVIVHVCSSHQTLISPLSNVALPSTIYCGVLPHWRRWGNWEALAMPPPPPFHCVSVCAVSFSGKPQTYAEYFSLNRSTAELVVLRPIDRELYRRFDLVIKVRNPPPPPRSQNVSHWKDNLPLEWGHLFASSILWD